MRPAGDVALRGHKGLLKSPTDHIIFEKFSQVLRELESSADNAATANINPRIRVSAARRTYSAIIAEGQGYFFGMW